MKRPKFSRTSIVFTGIFFVGALLLFAAYETKKLHDADELAYREEVKQFEAEKARRAAFPTAVASLDRLMNAGKFSESESMIQSLEKGAPKEHRAVLYHRRAEIHYAACESHLRSFIFFARAQDKEQSGLERDLATKECELSEKQLEAAINTGAQPIDFYGNYGVGNESVRKALSAVSAEAQVDALKQAIRAYVAALDAKHTDYETKVNLELLLDLGDKAEQAAKGGKNGKRPISPEEFSLQPDNAKGAGAGTGGKSQL